MKNRLDFLRQFVKVGGLLNVLEQSKDLAWRQTCPKGTAA